MHSFPAVLAANWKKKTRSWLEDEDAEEDAQLQVKKTKTQQVRVLSSPSAETVYIYNVFNKVQDRPL